MSFPGGSVVSLPVEDMVSAPGSGRSPVEEMTTHSVFLPGKSYGQRSLAGYIQSTGSQRVGNDLATKQQQLLYIK